MGQQQEKDIMGKMLDTMVRLELLTVMKGMSSFMRWVMDDK